MQQEGRPGCFGWLMNVLVKPGDWERSVQIGGKSRGEVPPQAYIGVGLLVAAIIACVTSR